MSLLPFMEVTPSWFRYEGVADQLIEWGPP
jgi:hypothetical protein